MTDEVDWASQIREAIKNAKDALTVAETRAIDVPIENGRDARVWAGIGQGWAQLAQAMIAQSEAVVMAFPIDSLNEVAAMDVVGVVAVGSEVHGRDLSAVLAARIANQRSVVPRTLDDSPLVNWRDMYHQATAIIRD